MYHDMNDIWEDDIDEPTNGQSWEFGEKLALSNIINCHFNQGYLKGIMQAKKLYSASGFEENYKKSALLGAKAGRLLGLLEGIQFYLEKRGETGENFENLKKWIKKVEKEIEINKIFSKEFLELNGLLKYDEHPILEGFEAEIINYLEDIKRNEYINTTKKNDEILNIRSLIPVIGI
ncbi:unnamed protein product [Pneumocystis jirovecii]|uniref:Protein YAE1 n=2 Tax=Pneumocystis jirovecii TaxID=42068 RepID=L0PCT8_PNEJI|nr:uncharacterized protein T551_01363 [Pneumocystis jirovecii RU7]KTW31291.1 hypothetical protein T551_01363 [Pneumocystis jirovecii RU7]CCJ29884.1 unnamed protein product [Pneumocystis jirovecii]